MQRFLKNTTMVGLLPVPHPIVIRKYQPNQYVVSGPRARTSPLSLVTAGGCGEQRDASLCRTHRRCARRYTNLWFTTFVWGVIFLRNQSLPIFDVKTIKLFSVTEV